jgi:hypothetical protein
MAGILGKIAHQNLFSFFWQKYFLNNNSGPKFIRVGGIASFKRQSHWCNQYALELI